MSATKVKKKGRVRNIRENYHTYPPIYYNSKGEVRFKRKIVTQYVDIYVKMYGEYPEKFKCKNNFSFNELDWLLCKIGNPWAWIEDPIFREYYLSDDYEYSRFYRADHSLQVV